MSRFRDYFWFDLNWHFGQALIAVNAFHFMHQLMTSNEWCDFKWKGNRSVFKKINVESTLFYHNEALSVPVPGYSLLGITLVKTLFVLVIRVIFHPISKAILRLVYVWLSHKRGLQLNPPDLLTRLSPWRAASATERFCVMRIAFSGSPPMLSTNENQQPWNIGTSLEPGPGGGTEHRGFFSTPIVPYLALILILPLDGMATNFFRSSRWIR